MSAFDQFLTDLRAPLVANSPMIPSTTANAANAIPFAASPTPLPPPQPPSNNKWMTITLIGALAFGAYYMAGGFGGGSSAAAPAKKSSRKRRVSRRRSTSRRKSRSKRRKGRGKITWGR